jgi:CheY-like chemotaxis protein
MSAEQSPKIVIVDESPIRAAILEEGLREAGFTGVVHISEMQGLLARIYALDPDVIVIDLENPSRDVLEQMFQVSRAVRRPIAMFVDQSDAASIQASVEAGRIGTGEVGAGGPQGDRPRQGNSDEDEGLHRRGGLCPAALDRDAREEEDR